MYRVTGRKNAVIAVLTAVQILNGLTGAAAALLLRRVVDSAAGGDAAAFQQAVIPVGLLIVCQQGLHAVIRWLSELSKSSIENLFKQRLLENILHRSYASVSAVHSGEWMNELTNDTKVVADGYTDVFPGLAGMPVRLCSAAALIVILDPRFAVLICGGGLILIALTYLIRKRLKQLHKQIQEKDGKLRVFLQERISSLMMVKSFTAEEQTEQEAIGKMEEHKAARMKRMRFSNLGNIGYGAAMQAMLLLGICYCAWGILTGTTSYGTLAAMMQLLSQIQIPMTNISGYLPRYYAMTASAERLMAIEQFPDEGTEKAISRDEVQKAYEKRIAALEMSHVDYTYYPAGAETDDRTKANMPVVLKDFNLRIRKGEYIAFTGYSGCGKSTVLKLLMSMYEPDAGEIVIREKDGGTLPMTAAWRRLFAYAPQGNMLMTGTIKEIISLAKAGEKPDGQRMEDALRIACAKEFTDGLEDGTDTLLGERGTGLSEGQMQRIAIARAIYSDTPILLLDEATSALDAATEEKLLINLKNMTDRTVIIVTHRPAALEICDRIIEFEEDGVRER